MRAKTIIKKSRLHNSLLIDVLSAAVVVALNFLFIAQSLKLELCNKGNAMQETVSLVACVLNAKYIKKTKQNKDAK